LRRQGGLIPSTVRLQHFSSEWNYTGSCGARRHTQRPGTIFDLPAQGARSQGGDPVDVCA
ncbi:MAG: hypothetical protein WBY44_08600, partial [Bryobacteraceae bacterium]